jgi:hypothetical protein
MGKWRRYGRIGPKVGSPYAGIPLALEIKVGYVVKDAKKWEAESKRMAVEFDANIT